MSTAAPLTLDTLKQKFETREARIGIVGMGYVACRSRCSSAAKRFRVTGFDIEPRQSQRRSTPAAPTSSASCPSRSSKRRKPASAPPPTTPKSPQMDAVIICVPTPLNEYHEPDLSYVTGTVEVHRALYPRRPA